MLQSSVVDDELTINRLERDVQLTHERMAEEIDNLEREHMLNIDHNRRTIEHLEQELIAFRQAFQGRIHGGRRPLIML